jgi:hypothetical protein
MLASEQWFHDKDPIKSARLYLEKHGAEEGIRLLEMPEIEGAQTLAFIVDDFVQEWAQHTETLLVDSTCEYNFKDYILSTNLLITQSIQTRTIWNYLRLLPICWARDYPSVISSLRLRQMRHHLQNKRRVNSMDGRLSVHSESIPDLHCPTRISRRSTPSGGLAGCQAPTMPLAYTQGTQATPFPE